VLTQLIHTAIAQNYDVRIAAASSAEAQAQVGITRSNQFPSASVGADIYSQQNAKVTKVFPAYQVNAGDLNLSVIWNLDFWGKYSQTDRGGSSPITRHRVGAASGDFFSDRQCSNSLFPATGARQ